MLCPDIRRVICLLHKYAEVDTLLHYIYIYIHRHKHIVTLSKKMQPFFSFFEIIVRTSPDPAKQSLETRSWGS